MKPLLRKQTACLRGLMDYGWGLGYWVQGMVFMVFGLQGFGRFGVYQPPNLC